LDHITVKGRKKRLHVYELHAVRDSEDPELSLNKDQDREEETNH